MDKAFVVQGVANKVWATENAIDSAISEASELMVTLMKARQELRAAAMVDDKAARKLGETINLLMEARSAIVESHAEMAEAKLRLGIRTKLVGTYDKPPPPPGSGGVTDYAETNAVARLVR